MCPLFLGSLRKRKKNILRKHMSSNITAAVFRVQDIHPINIQRIFISENMYITIALDKRGYLCIIFISPQKTYVVVLIRSALALMSTVPTTYVFMQK